MRNAVAAYELVSFDAFSLRRDSGHFQSMVLRRPGW